MTEDERKAGGKVLLEVLEAFEVYVQVLFADSNTMQRLTADILPLQHARAAFIDAVIAAAALRKEHRLQGHGGRREH